MLCQGPGLVMVDRFFAGVKALRPLRGRAAPEP